MTDGERFVQAVQETSGSMLRVAMLMLRRRADAEDAVSTAIEQAWRRREAIREEAALPAYLLRCTVHACHHTLRRRQQTVPLDSLADWLQAPPGETPVWMYLGSLPEKLRLPVLLRYGEGLSEKEIAQVLGVPRGTVSSRLARGLQALRREMEEEEAHHE